MKFATLLVMMACVACQAQGRAQDEEPRPISRGLLKRGLLAKGKATTTTTTTTQAPQEEAEYEDEAEYPAEGEAAEPSTEAPASSTEGKKLVGSGVRPFRSNTDLLEALKRRRAQVAEAKLHTAGHPTSAPGVDDKEATEAPVKANFSKKRYNSASRDSNDDSPAPNKPRPSRFGRPASKAIQSEPEQEEQNDAAPPTRQARTFTRRGGN